MTTDKSHTLWLSNTTYDVLRWIVTVVFPALGAAYFGLAAIWGFPFGEQIVGTLAVLTTFGGVLLKISSTQYKKHPDGEILITPENTQNGLYPFKVDIPYAELEGRDTITIKVNKDSH